MTCAIGRRSMRHSSAATWSSTSLPRSAWSAIETSTCRSTSTAPATCSPRPGHNGLRGVVHVSSPSVAHDGRPIVGGAADPPVADHGAAWYPETKAIAERDALAASDDQCAVVAIRPHLVWGPGDTQLVGRIVERAAAGRLALVGGGRALVDTTYIDNAATALVAAVDAVRPGAACAGKAYVVSNGEPRPIRELVEAFCRAADVPFEPRNVPLPRRPPYRLDDRSGLAAARAIRRAAADPVPRRTAGHRALVRSAGGSRRPRLGARVSIDEGLDAARRMVRRRSHRAPLPLASTFAGDVAEWLRQRPAKPCTRVRFPASPPAPEQGSSLLRRSFRSSHGSAAGDR